MWCQRPLARILLAGLLLVAATALPAQGSRLLSSAAVTVRDDHQDLAIEFGCSMRYLGHNPASQGDEVRIRLQPGRDCALPLAAQFPTEHLLPADGRDLVRDIELQPGLGGGAELLVRWNRVEKFVLAPDGAMRGLRIRVARNVSSRVIVDEEPAHEWSFSVNLLSSREAMPEDALARALAKLRTPVYVSDIDVDGQAWHRLRAGPFESRREAERVLREALQSYPTAWLAIDDEASATAREPVTSNTPRIVRPPELRADPGLDLALARSRTAMSHRQFDEAIAQLTLILVSEDYVRRVEAAELLGLARERKGQLAQAKATYEEFLRRYPDASAAPRVRDRLQALRTASLAGRRGSGSGASGEEAWMLGGSASQLYRRDNSQLQGGDVSRDLMTQHAVFTDADFIARRRGERFDFTSRLSAGYQKDLLPQGPGDQVRVSYAFVELNDRELGISGRVGRQSRGMAGVPGTFDGVLGNWQWRPEFGFSIAAGLPADSTRKAPDADRQFVGAGANFTSANHSWDTSVYAIAQQYSGATDRRAIGAETRLFKSGRTLFALAEYDVHFAEFNNLMLLGTLVLDSRWTFSFDASRQRSPQLSLRNALIGQPTTDFGDLSSLFPPGELDQIALDRSAVLSQFGLSAGHPLGERGQWTLNLLSTNLSGMPASGGVEAVISPGRDDTLISEFLVNSLFRAGDVNSIVLRAQRGESGNLLSVGLGSRLPIGESLRLTSRLRVDRRDDVLADSPGWIYVPSLRLDYLRRRASFEFEMGAEFGQQDRAGVVENSTRYFVSLGYRLTFSQD